MEVGNLIYFDKPAQMWEEALPIGNGNIGGMVYGAPYHEQISLNDDTLWSGFPANHNPPNGAIYYKQAVDLTLQGRYNEVQDIIEEKLESDYTEGYLPLGDLWIDTGHVHVSDYKRYLSLEQAVATVEYNYNDIRYKRECFVSYPQKCLVVKFTSDTPESLNLKISLTTQLKGESYVDGKKLVLKGLAPSNVEPIYSAKTENIVTYEDDDSKKGMRFTAMADITTQDGVCFYEFNKISVKKASSVMIVLCTQTSFNGTYEHPYLNGLDEITSCAQRIAKIEKIMITC